MHVVLSFLDLSVPVVEQFARGGGGGSGGSSGGGSGGGAIALVAALICLYISHLIYRHHIKQARRRQRRALLHDGSWSDEIIQTRVREVFSAFQTAWSDRNPAGLEAWLTPRYAEHVRLMLQALADMHRYNLMSRVGLLSVELFGVDDRLDDEQDRFAVLVKARADDQLVDDRTGELLYQGKPWFEEVWHFEREDRVWKLDGIDQVDEDLITDYTPDIKHKYREFAQQTGFYYNQNFGVLMLPLYGYLFSAANFSQSMVRDHMVGTIGDKVVQLYSYLAKNPNEVSIVEYLRHLSQRNRLYRRYTIGQFQLHEVYGNCFVRRRLWFGWSGFAPDGLKRLTHPQERFNRHFQVYAADPEDGTRLLLLQPDFLDKLIALPFAVGFEVVDNTVFFYSASRKADYPAMLALIREAVAFTG